MEFKQFMEAQYPIGKGVAPPPRGVQRQLQPTDVLQQRMQKQKMGQGDNYQQQLMRIAQGKFTPEEQQVVNKQKEEMQRFGVVFTPFKFYGGGQNPRSDLSQFNF